MKALSLRQPWAWAVLNGKDVENRVWKTNFRGYFFIHAAKACSPVEYDCGAAWIERASGLVVPPLAELERGGIVGRALLYDVLRPHDDCELAWHMHDQHGFRLNHVAPVDFVPCAGSLNFFRLPTAVEETLRARGAHVVALDRDKDAAPWDAARTDPPQRWREFGSGAPMCSWCGARDLPDGWRTRSTPADCPLCPLRSEAA